MSNKTILVLSMIVLASVGGVFLSQRKLVSSLEKKMASMGNGAEYKKYVSYLFSMPFSGEELAALDDLVEKEPSKIVVMIPASVCRSCFFSLFQFLHEDGVQGNEAVVYLVGNDEVLIRELKRWRYEDIRRVEMTGQEGMTDIMIARIANNGWQRLYMKYQDGYENVVSLFLRE